MQLIAEHITDVADSFLAMQKAIARFNERLLSKSRPSAIRVYQPLTGDGALNEVAAVLGQHFYLDEQDPRSVILLPGIIAGNQSLRKLALEVNAAKLDFKEAVLDLKESGYPLSNSKVSQKFFNKLHRHPLTELALARTGLKRLHLKQCYRLLTVLDESPTSIRYTWARTRAITKISKSEALKRLERVGRDAGIARQMKKLATLSDHESLAIVQQLQPHLRANIVMNEERFMVSASLPIIAPELPEAKYIKLPDEPGAQTRETRSDLKIESKPFLPAIRAYRYL